MSTDERIDPHIWRIVSVFVLGAMMSVLDATIVNVALRDLSADLHAPLDQIQWVATGYLLAIAAVIPVAGWATRRFGTRNVYIASLVMFTLGSLFCALSWNAESLIAFRVLQGAGGGLVMPVGQMIVIKAAGPKNLSKVMAAAGVPILLAPVLGPTLGGALLQVASWHWIFLINLPVGIAAVVAALRLLPPNEREQAGALDFLGLGLAVTGAVAVTYGLAESGQAGSLVATSVVVPVLIGLALLTAFVLRSLAVGNPLLDVRLFKHRQFALGAVVIATVGAVMFGGMILMPLYFQVVRGLSPFDTGLLLAPQGIGMACAMAAGQRLTDRIGGGQTALYGLMFMAVFTVPFVLFTDTTPYAVIDGVMLLRGFGVGLVFMPVMTSAYRQLSKEHINDATAQLTVLQRIGGSMGTALLTVVLQSHLDGARTLPQAAGAFQDTFAIVLALSLLALVPVGMLAAFERSVRRRPATAPTQADEIALSEMTA